MLATEELTYSIMIQYYIFLIFNILYNIYFEYIKTALKMAFDFVSIFSSNCMTNFVSPLPIDPRGVFPRYRTRAKEINYSRARDFIEWKQSKRAY